VLAPTSLPSVGGRLRAEQVDFGIAGTISIGRAYTEVSGAENPQDQSFDTLVTSTIEGLDISGVLKANKITMKIATKHPATATKKYFPTVSFPDTHYEELSVNGFVIEPKLDLSAFVTDGYPDESWLYNSKLKQFAINQSKQFTAEAKKLPSAAKLKAKDMQVFTRFRKRHSRNGPNGPAAIRARGNIICTVVNTITVPQGSGLTSVGNTLFIPNFGRVFFGELIVDGSSFNLTMMRVDMGSAKSGSGSGPQGGANGGNTGGI
jgi:hypothetical protein